MNIIARGTCPQHLGILLEFLAAWEKRPMCLTPMAYQWCSAISKAARGLRPSEIPTSQQDSVRLRPQDLDTGKFADLLSTTAEAGFSRVGPGCNPTRSDTALHHTHGHRQYLTLNDYVKLLSIVLDIGFRLDASSRDWSTLHLSHTPHHEWMFEVAFSSNDDAFIADAVSVWIASDGRTLPGSCVRYLAKRVEKTKPFSPTLRQTSIRTIERIWHDELKASGPETVLLLNRLTVNADDIVDGYSWAGLLVDTIRSPTGLKNLSFHYWRLLDKMLVDGRVNVYLVSRDVEVMTSLEESEDWGKLVIWMVVVWSFLPGSNALASESMEDIERATLMLLLQRPSALPRFEDLCEGGMFSPTFYTGYREKLQRICDRARGRRLPSESPPPSVLVCPTQRLSILTFLFLLPQILGLRTTTGSLCFRRREELSKAPITYTTCRCTEPKGVLTINEVIFRLKPQQLGPNHMRTS